MDILGLGYIGVKSPNASERPTFGPQVLGLAIGYGVIPGHTGMHHIGMGVNDLDDVGIAQDRAQERGDIIYSSLGRHIQDPVYSVYLGTPSGFGIEYLTGGIANGMDSILTEHNPERLSVWGQTTMTPGLPKTVRPVG